MHLTDRLHISPSKWRSRLPKFVCLCSLSYKSISVGSLIFDLCLLDGNNESAFQAFNIFRYKGFYCTVFYFIQVNFNLVYFIKPILIVVYYIFLNLLENIIRLRYLSNNIYTYIRQQLK